MAFKLKARTQFPANVSAASPVIITKNGVSYVFSIDVNTLINSVIPLIPSPDASSVTYTAPFTGTSQRTISSVLKEAASLLDFIPPSQHAAIQNYTTTYDASADIDEAIAATIGKIKLHAPYGKYISTTGHRIATSSSSTFSPGFWMEGDGGGATIFDNQVAATARTENFATTNASGIVTVNRTAHGKVAGQQFQVVDSVGTVGGLAMDGDWYISSIPNANQFTFTHTLGASSTTNGNVSYNEVNPLFDIDTTTDLKFQQFIRFANFKVANFTSPTRSTAFRFRRAYHTLLENIWIDGMTCDGIHIAVPNPSGGDRDAPNQFTVRHSRIENCLRWLANCEMRSGNNELSYTDFDTCSFQAGGVNGAAFAATSGGLRWKGQGLLVRNSFFTICNNTPLFIEGGAGLSNMFAIRDTTFENNVRKGPYITGVQSGEFTNIQLYQNDGAVGVTVSNGGGAVAGVVTLANHTFGINRPFLFGGTAAPAPAVLGTIYYVRATNLTANTFEFSAAPGGAAILTTSTGTAVTVSSGVATSGIEIDGANFVISNVRVKGLTLRVSSGNNPYTAFLLSGANADGRTCTVDPGSIAFKDFDYAGQTRFTGWNTDVTAFGTTSGSIKISAPAAAGTNTMTLPAATDTFLGKATTDILTNKTFDTAGAGNSFSINGVAVTANTGTGSVVRATAPTFPTTINVTGNITSSGTNQTFGPGTTGAVNAQIILDGGSGSNSGAIVSFRRNSVPLFSFGNAAAILGGASDDFFIYSNVSGAGTNAAISVSSANSNVTINSGIATPAGGSTAARLLFGTTAGFGVYYGSGAPTVSAAKGSLYLRSDGSGTTDRMYVNTNGTTTWTAVTTVA